MPRTSMCAFHVVHYAGYYPASVPSHGCPLFAATPATLTVLYRYYIVLLSDHYNNNHYNNIIVAKIILKPHTDPKRVHEDLKKIGITMCQKLPDGSYNAYVSNRALFEQCLKQLGL